MSALRMNTQTFALSQFTDHNFLAVNSRFAVTADGVYERVGSSDNGALIAARFLTGQSAFQSQQFKIVQIIHVEHTGAELDTLVQYDEVEVATPTVGRSKPGKGYRAVRLAFGARNVQGRAFQLRTLEPTIYTLPEKGNT